MGFSDQKLVLFVCFYDCQTSGETWERKDTPGGHREPWGEGWKGKVSSGAHK